MTVRQYVGARYVPIFDGDYNPSKEYEPLTIVYYNNSSYTSRKQVPAGIVPTNTEYWALTGNFNGAITALTDRVNAAEDEIEEVSERYPRRKYYMPEMYGAVVNDITVDCSPAIKAAILDANDNGGIVLLSEGVYNCDSSIAINTQLNHVIIKGTGRTVKTDNIADNPGTSLLYTGSDTFIHFGAGMMECVLEDFDIRSYNAGSTCLKLSAELGTESTARTTRTIIHRMNILFTSIGIHCSNAAYLDLDELFIRSTSDYAILNKCGLYCDGHNEYVNLTRSRVVAGIISDLSGTVYNSACIRLHQGTHFYFYNVDMTTADVALDIPIDNTANVAFTDLTDCNMAWIHFGIRVTLTSTSLQLLTTNNLVFTCEDTADTRDRVILVEKVTGGGAYGARIKSLNTSIRLGEETMVYWVEATHASALFPGACEFTFSTSKLPKFNFGGETRVQDLSTIGTYGSVTDDLDAHTWGGFIPYRFNTSSNGSPGFDCMIINFASQISTVQIAIPVSASRTIAFRTYDKSGGTWSEWQLFAKES